MLARRRMSKVRAIAARDGWDCRYCRKTLSERTATIDHVVPRCRGGCNANCNLVLACRKCNTNRGHLPAPVFELLCPWRAA